MVNEQVFPIPRARYEHYKSEPQDPKTYVVLGFRAIEEGVLVEYVADYDRAEIQLRTIEEFCNSVESDDIGTVPRFKLVQVNAMTHEDRDILLDELPDA